MLAFCDAASHSLNADCESFSARKWSLLKIGLVAFQGLNFIAEIVSRRPRNRNIGADILVPAHDLLSPIAVWASRSSCAGKLWLVFGANDRKRFSLVKAESSQVPFAIRTRGSLIISRWPVSDWCQRAGFRGLEDIEPITVAAYVKQHSGSPATIKQHLKFDEHMTESVKLG
jgi:hypothetical protein